jgi:hypothetical protein
MSTLAQDDCHSPMYLDEDTVAFLAEEFDN